MAIAAVILEFIDGPEKGRAVRIADFGPTLLGRGADSDIRLPAVDSTVSRQQVYIEVSPDSCVLTRVKGSNRVVELNHRDVDYQCNLVDGDVLRLGLTVVRIALALVDTTCLICGKTVDGSDVDRDDLREVSIHAHELCIDLGRSRHEHFNEYEACRLVDEQAAGLLYQVYDRKTRRVWALKQLPGVSQSPRMELAVQRRVAIRHPNIIRCVQRGVDQEGVSFLVTEFASGGSLERFVRRGGHSPRVALQLIDDVLESLKFLHTLGTAHGDLHPASIVVQREPRASGVRIRAKLVDPGIAGDVAPETPESPGSPWRPPEHGLRTCEPQDDIYSAAAILRFMLTRRLPSELIEIGEGDCSPDSGPADNAPFVGLSPTVRPDLASILDRACHKNPAKRFRSVQQLQDVIRQRLNYC
jgi:hypothetical protein